MQDTNSQGRQKYKIGHGIDDLKVIMNKKNPRTNQFRQLFNYLLNLDTVTSEGSQNNVSINHN
jgi:hypothetical protein